MASCLHPSWGEVLHPNPKNLMVTIYILYSCYKCSWLGGDGSWSKTWPLKVQASVTVFWSGQSSWHRRSVSLLRSNKHAVPPQRRRVPPWYAATVYFYASGWMISNKRRCWLNLSRGWDCAFLFACLWRNKAAEMKLHDLFNLSKVKVLSEAREIQSGGVFSIFRFQACLEICGTAWNTEEMTEMKKLKSFCFSFSPFHLKLWGIEKEQIFLSNLSSQGGVSSFFSFIWPAALIRGGGGDACNSFLKLHCLPSPHLLLSLQRNKILHISSSSSFVTVAECFFKAVPFKKKCWCLIFKKVK